MRDPFLQALLEAPGDEAGGGAGGMTDPFAVNTDSPTDQPADTSNAATPGDDPMGGADPFGGDPMGGDANDPTQGMDMNNNPDGLPGPDATGDPNLGSFSGEDDKNLQVKIIQATKLERSMLKRQIFDRFRSLYNKIDIFRANIDNNQTVIDPKIREGAYTALQQLSDKLNTYIDYKFSPNNYEENLKNYLVFARKLSEIIDYSTQGLDDKKGK